MVCTGASPCQLQTLLRCSPSGLFEEVQCDPSRGQCWCVDQDGMELYGTRQSGRLWRCEYFLPCRPAGSVGRMT